MNRFTPDELYEIFNLIGEDGDLTCPVFVSHIEDVASVSKCLDLGAEDQRALGQSLRLARRALSQEIADIESIEESVLENIDHLMVLEERKYELSSKLCRMMRNFI